jgi:tetratricopeptide (TPR) repeat protein
MLQSSNGLRPIDEGYRLAREAVDKALAVDPDFAPAHAALGWIAMENDADLAASARHFEHALALDPTDTAIIAGAAVLAVSLGRVAQAVALDEYVTARDPMNPNRHLDLAIAYHFAGRWDEAIESYRTSFSLGSGYGQFGIGLALLLKGDPNGALAAMQKESSENWRLIGLPMAWHALGKKAESDAALAELIRKFGKESAYNIAYVLAYRGEADRAFAWLDKAVANNDAGLTDIAVDPLLANLHQDPRWLPFLRKLGRAPEQLAAIKFDVKVQILKSGS